MSSNVVGHERTLRILAHAWESGRLAHAYLFVGPEGVGKRLVARRLAQTVLCVAPIQAELAGCGRCPSCLTFGAGTHPDYAEIGLPEGKQELPIDAIRKLTAEFGLKPALGARRVAVVDDADVMNDEAANAFLKTLEEPPPGSLLILLATDEARQLPTIVSRCQIVRFAALTDDEVSAILIASGEVANPAEAKQLAALAGGSASAALELSDREWRRMRGRLWEELAAARPALHLFAKEAIAFCEDAGKEAYLKRRRARQLTGVAHGLLRAALRRRELGETASDAEDARLVDSLAQRYDSDVLMDLQERTLQADFHLQRNLHQQLTMECWFDDLGQIMAGRYVPAVGRVE